MIWKYLRETFSSTTKRNQNLANSDKTKNINSGSPLIDAISRSCFFLRSYSKVINFIYIYIPIHLTVYLDNINCLHFKNHVLKNTHTCISLLWWNYVPNVYFFEIPIELPGYTRGRRVVAMATTIECLLQDLQKACPNYITLVVTARPKGRKAYVV